MAQEEEKVIVEIFGEKHVVRGQESPEHILKVARIVDKKMRQIEEPLPRLAIHQIAILAALNLADELEKLREEQETLLQLIEEQDK